MGLHLLIIGKINLMATSSQSLSTPLLVSLLWPFVLKLAAFSCRPIGQVYSDLAYSLRLFSFQMSQITFNTTTDQSTGGSGGSGGGSGGGFRAGAEVVSHRSSNEVKIFSSTMALAMGMFLSSRCKSSISLWVK